MIVIITDISSFKLKIETNTIANKRRKHTFNTLRTPFNGKKIIKKEKGIKLTSLHTAKFLNAVEASQFVECHP